MSIVPPLVVRVADYPSPLKVVNDRIHVLASGAQTQGCEVFIQAGPEGSGPQPHKHDWDETFFVLEGAVRFGIGDNELEQVAEVGTLVHLPAGNSHWFKFTAGGGKLLSFTSRLAVSKFFADMDQEISPSSPDFTQARQVAIRNGLVPPEWQLELTPR